VSTTDCNHRVTWGVAGRPLPGESESGDLHVALDLSGGLLLAVIDGLGHGPAAAEAARTVAATLRANASELLPDLMRICHDESKGSRGVVLTVARIDAGGTLSWLGVGNVTGLLWRRNGAAFAIRSMAPLARGVLGSHLPPLHEKQIGLLEDDTLVLCSDGIIDAEQWTPVLLAEPTDAAGALVIQRGRPDDDALALVGRYAGS
jgi:negative regulator of sigma-B (phosphoserine phosphatase)